MTSFVFSTCGKWTMKIHRRLLLDPVLGEAKIEKRRVKKEPQQDGALLKKMLVK